MRVEVDLDKCTGHGICESIADDVFEVQDDGIVLIHDNERPESDRDRMQQAVTQCPVCGVAPHRLSARRIHRQPAVGRLSFWR